MSEKNQPTEYSNTYQTGSTSPPKSHVGVVAFLLSATIFICGVSTIFSLMRINLLQKVLVQAENQECDMAFSHGQTPVSYQLHQTVLQIQGYPLDAFWQSYHNLPQGIYVTETRGQPLRTGDIIIDFDSTPVTDWETMDALLSQHSPGDTVSVTVYRNGKQTQLTLFIYE